jgi:hypothetical protein
MDREAIEQKGLGESVIEIADKIIEDVIELDDEEQKALEEHIKGEFDLIINIISKRLDSVEDFEDLDEEYFDTIGKLGLSVCYHQGRVMTAIKDVIDNG